MSEQKTVFNKLWKSNSTELASHKVELALIDDIKKMYAPLGGKFLSLESDLFDVKKSMLDLKQEFENLLSKTEKANQIAKELGATEVVSIISEFDSASKQKIKDIISITSKIN